jgi:tetratricopeptide (TPR) repeat protein
MAQGRAHFDQALSFHDSALQRELSSQEFATGTVHMLMWRSSAMWLCGYPEAAIASADQALRNARQIGSVSLLMTALNQVAYPHIWSGHHETGKALLDELCVLAKQRGSAYWNACGTVQKGYLCCLTGHSLDSISMINAALAELRPIENTIAFTIILASLAAAHADLGQFDNAWREIGDAKTLIERSKERYCEAEVHRMAGEIALLEPKPDVAKAEAYFGRALSVARPQPSKSWELRSAMSMARLWRDQGKRDEARKLLAPVYGWFTEGFDTRDLKEAKAFLEELAA